MSPKQAAKNLRELAEAYADPEGSTLPCGYPRIWLEARELSGESYQDWYELFTGKAAYEHPEITWSELLYNTTREENVLTWLFLAEAIESGDF